MTATFPDEPTRGGPWTRHGHVIPGVTVAGPGRPPVARCGGPGLCHPCSMDAAAAQTRPAADPPTVPVPIKPDPVADPARKRDEDAGREAQEAVEAHLDACDAAEAWVDEGGNYEDPEAKSPAIGPYCACRTCEIRETLAVAWPIILADAAALVEGHGHTAAAFLLQAEARRMEPKPFGAAA